MATTRLYCPPPGTALNEPARPLDMAALLQGDNSAEAFAEMMREHAISGVSGVVPKFLDTEKLTGLGNPRRERCSRTGTSSRAHPRTCRSCPSTSTCRCRWRRRCFPRPRLKSRAMARRWSWIASTWMTTAASMGHGGLRRAAWHVAGEQL